MVLLVAGFTCDENFCFSSSMERLTWAFLLHVVMIYHFMDSVGICDGLLSSKTLKDGGLVWGCNAGIEGIWTLVETFFSQSHVRISHKNYLSV